MQFKGTFAELPKHSRTSRSAAEDLPTWPSIKKDIEADSVKPGEFRGFIVEDADLESVGLAPGVSGRRALVRVLAKLLEANNLTDSYVVKSFQRDGTHYAVAVKPKEATKKKRK